MSLDVTLTGKTTEVPCVCSRCYHEHLRDKTEEFFSANVTHNLGAMAREAGLYVCLWHPEDIGITKAIQLIEPLRAGLALMKSDPERFKKYDPLNKWGSYDVFVPWIENYLKACEENPDADVSVSR